MTLRHFAPRRFAFAILFVVQACVAFGAALEGTVLDINSGEGVSFCEIQIVDLQRGVLAHADGSFHFPRLPAGVHRLSFSRIGYQSAERTVTLHDADTLRIEVRLVADNVQLDAVDITAELPAGTSQSVQISGLALQEQVASTVAESFAKIAGISVRSMGPAPARPVSRGLGGPRLMILEDGQPTGDLSASSSDHAVAIDPLLAQSLELVRGPAAYHYGSSVVGGVVNVERNALMQSEPHRMSLGAQVQGETATKSGASSVVLSLPWRKLTVHADGSHRRSGDLETAKSSLANTQSTRESGSIGASWIDRWGFAGIAVSGFSTAYGLPGGFLGAHPQGVSVDMDRQAIQTRAGWHISQKVLKEIEAEYSFTRVHQQEFESSGALGVEFGLLIDQARIEGKLGSVGSFQDTRISWSGSLRDYETAAFSFTPDSRHVESGIAVSTILPTGAWTLSAAARGDVSSIEPEYVDTSRVIGVIRSRNFVGLSGAVSAERSLDQSSTLSLQFSRSFRAPQIEELFSEGPHLAAYSYEVGNPELGAELGWAAELQINRVSKSGSVSASVFVDRYENYIFPVATGRQSEVRNDLELYRYDAKPASLWGGEANASWDVTEFDRFSLQLSFVRGQILGGENLPSMPPVSATLEYERELFGWKIAPRMVGAAKQSRIGEFESPTAAYLRYDLSVSRYWASKRGLLMLAARIENVLDTEYRNHLSRVRTIVPEAGRGAIVTISVQL